jgi:hypothetical protein
VPMRPGARPVDRPDGAPAGASGHVRYAGEHMVPAGAGITQLNSDMSKKFAPPPEAPAADTRAPPPNGFRKFEPVPDWVGEGGLARARGPPPSEHL